MRQTTWDKRLPTHEHERRFHHLLALHELTLAWLEAIRVDLSSKEIAHKMDRGLQAKALGTVQVSDLLNEISRDRGRERSLPGGELSSLGIAQFMDDTQPEDVVQRLEYGVWVTQAHTLKHVLDLAETEDHPALRNVLEQASWRTGRARAEARWPFFPEDLKMDLRGLFQASCDTPFMGASEPGGILLERSLKLGITVRYTKCAHHSRYAEVRPMASELCELHAHWLRGFAYALQPRARIESNSDAKGGCIHHWEAVNSSK